MYFSFAQLSNGSLRWGFRALIQCGATAGCWWPHYLSSSACHETWHVQLAVTESKFQSQTGTP